MKSISTPLIRVAIVVGALGLGACASTDYHYSQLYGYRYFKVPIDTYSVTIVRVDDQTTALRPVAVDPGRRKITVQGPPGGTKTQGEQRDFVLDVAPCTRYYLVAVKDNRLASDFTVKVEYQEPLSGCTPPPASASASS
jgi:hypothetical protein